MITEGYLARHYQGRADGRGPALIDIAQDHALHLLHEAGVFELGAVLKGGTAIRKFRAVARRARSGLAQLVVAARPVGN